LLTLICVAFSHRLDKKPGAALLDPNGEVRICDDCDKYQYSFRKGDPTAMCKLLEVIQSVVR